MHLIYIRLYSDKQGVHLLRWALLESRIFVVSSSPSLRTGVEDVLGAEGNLGGCSPQGAEGNLCSLTYMPLFMLPTGHHVQNNTDMLPPMSDLASGKLLPLW